MVGGEGGVSSRTPGDGRGLMTSRARKMNTDTERTSTSWWRRTQIRKRRTGTGRVWRRTERRWRSAEGVEVVCDGVEIVNRRPKPNACGAE